MPQNSNNDVKKTPGIFYIEDMVANSAGSVFCLARMAMLRALELASGKDALILHSLGAKTATIALEEIAQGKVILKGKVLTKRDSI